MNALELGLKTLQVLVANNYINRRQLQEAIDAARTSVEVNEFVCESVNAMLEEKVAETATDEFDELFDGDDEPAKPTRKPSESKRKAASELNVGYAEEICGFVARMHRTPIETNEDERLLYNRLSKHRSRYNQSNDSIQPLDEATVEVYVKRDLLGILQHQRIRDAYEGTIHCEKWNS